MPPQQQQQEPTKKPNKIVLVVKKRRKRHLSKNDHHTTRRRQRVSRNSKKSKPGIPNLTKELTHPPSSATIRHHDGDYNEDNDSEDEFQTMNNAMFPPPFEDAIPCDTLLAFQSLTQTTATTSSRLSLTIPLQASMESIPCVLESQLYSVLRSSSSHGNNNNKNTNNFDHDSMALVTRELQDLIHQQHVLRRLSSITNRSTGSSSQSLNNLTVLILTQDYIRGVWDAHDMMMTTTAQPSTAAAATTNNNGQEQQQERENNNSNNDDDQQHQQVHRFYVQWWVDHLHCWTGQWISSAQLQETWAQDPPPVMLQYKYNTTLSLSKALDYWQRLDILMTAHQQRRRSAADTTSSYQLWLPQWGTVLSTFQTAYTKFLQKIRYTYQKELSEQSFLQQPYYHQISTRLLYQHLQDQGIVQTVPKPSGNFIQLVQASKQHTTTKKSSSRPRAKR